LTCARSVNSVNRLPPLSEFIDLRSQHAGDGGQNRIRMKKMQRHGTGNT
jgi:hypothetical protein